MKLADKVVVITGGSRGFGKALALACAKQGARVVITSRNTDEYQLETNASSMNANYFVADATSHEQTEALADYVKATYGRIDIWINNAAIIIAPSPIEEVNLTRLHDTFALNFFGYFYGCQAAVRIMKPQKSGLIINVNSTAGLEGKPGMSAYSSSKFAVRGLSEAIRAELKDSGVAVHQVFPGGMKTSIHNERVPADFDHYMDVGYAVEKLMANLAATEPELDLVIRRPTAG